MSIQKNNKQMSTSEKKSFAEQKLKDFFSGAHEIERLNHNLDLLYRHKSETQKDIYESNTTLDPNMKVINYNNNKIRTFSTNHPQEKSINHAFDKLEKKLQKLDEEIIDVKYEIREIEKKINDISFLINKMSKESYELIKLKYKDKKSAVYICSKLHLSESGFYRLKELILTDLSNFLFN